MLPATTSISLAVVPLSSVSLPRRLTVKSPAPEATVTCSLVWILAVSVALTSVIAPPVLTT